MGEAERSPSSTGFRRPWHRRVQRVIESLNSGLLSSAKCYFGGGTRIAMALGEFRESVDIDFLCSDRDGYRTLRSTVTELSLRSVVLRSAVGPLRAAPVHGAFDGAGSYPLTSLTCTRPMGVHDKKVGRMMSCTLSRPTRGRGGRGRAGPPPSRTR